MCEVPSISSDCLSGPREILAPNTDINKQLHIGDGFEIAKYGILYPVKDIKALQNAIEYLLENKELYKEYKNKSIERANDFSIYKIIDKYKEVICVE